MTAESALKFGPEWLRALSQGNGTTAATSTSISPPSSPELPKYKLAEYRYGREEMLALFSKDIKMPRELRQFNGLSKEVCQLPMALIEFTEEEQKLWSRSVNSEAVLRIMGRAATGVAPGPPAHRGGRGGGSVDRGRGRATYYQRGLSSEELDLPTPGGLTRQRSYERTNSERSSGWEDGFRERKYDKSFSVRDDDVGSSIRKDGSSTVLDWRSGNLRSNHIRDGGEDENGRKLGGTRTDKWGRSNWRSERDERQPDMAPDWSGSTRAPYRKPTGGHVRLRDDDFNGEGDLPEWSMEDNKDAEKVGTFDATGAFLETKEEKEGDGVAAERIEDVDSSVNSNASSDSSSSSISQENNSDKPISSSAMKVETKHETSGYMSTSYVEVQHEEDKTTGTTKEIEAPDYPVQPPLPTKIEKDPIPDMLPVAVPPEFTVEKKEDINFEHLEKAAESLVDAIEDDEKVDVHQTANLANSWYYRDPQGVVQGPFSDFEMAEWYRTGYFDLGLMVRQGLKGRFCTLGDLVNLRNCVPFMSSQPINGDPTPIPRPTMAAVQPGRALLGGISNHAAMPLPPQFDIVNDDPHMRFIQQQIIHQRLLQQQYQQPHQRFTRQPLQQLLGGASSVDNLAAAVSSNPQQYYLMQKLMMAQQQPPGGLTRNPNPEPSNLHDPVRQLAAQLAATQPTMSLKEDGPSLWNMPAPSVIASRGMPNMGVGWRPKSVWDIDGTAAGHDKVVAANMMPTEQQLLAEEQKKKRAAEEELLRIQREEEERRRRIQEEQEQRERLRLEELRRREQEEEERREKEELLKKQQQQLEMEERKRKESEERRLREEEERRLKEERLREEQLRKQEEERRKEEFFMLMQQEQQRLEELKRKEKRRQLEEEEKAKAEHQREQMELKIRQAEALKKLQEKQKQKQGPAWGGSAPSVENALSLVEIQRIQEEKEQQDKINREIQQQLLLQQQLKGQLSAQQQQARSMTNMTWAERSNVALGPVKSLLEIQKEEAEKLAQLKEKQAKQQQQQQTANNNIAALSTAGVWSNSSSHLRQTSNSTSIYPWNTENTPQHATNGGAYFWDEQLANTNKARGQSWPTPAKNQEAHATSNGQTSKTKTARAKKEEETVMKLFEAPKLNVDEFTEWCIQALSDLQSTIDVPTFVSFLKDVDSPYEVHDYVRQYLGEGKEVHNFTKQFLENRSKYRNQARKNQVEENMWGPARAINPSLSKPQTNELDGFKTSGGKKKKKSKMQKVDNNFLGFTVHASLDRINIGDIDHGEDM